MTVNRYCTFIRDQLFAMIKYLWIILYLDSCESTLDSVSLRIEHKIRKWNKISFELMPPSTRIVYQPKSCEYYKSSWTMQMGTRPKSTVSLFQYLDAKKTAPNPDGLLLSALLPSV